MKRHKKIEAVTGLCMGDVDADVGAGDEGADESGVRSAAKKEEIGVCVFFRWLLNGVEAACIMAAGVGH